tara:strand:- start:253 stop:393 length:141 start_codon:yes stop_codon:yes gene_type:complete
MQVATMPLALPNAFDAAVSFISSPDRACFLRLSISRRKSRIAVCNA